MHEGEEVKEKKVDSRSRRIRDIVKQGVENG